MGIELYWDNEDEKIMLAEFEPDWTWDEMFNTLDDIKKVTSQRSYEIAAIIDVRCGITIPGGNIFSPQTRDHALRMLKMSESGKGPIAIVGPVGPLKVLAGAFSMIDRQAMDDVYMVASLEEARQVLMNRLEQGKAAKV